MTRQPPSGGTIRRTATTIATAWLVGIYLLVTWATAAVAIVMATTGSTAVGAEASVHAVILALVSILTLVFTVNVWRRRPRAELRVRVIAIILAAALVVTAVVLPLPIWMIVGHAIGAALLLATLVVLWPRPEPQIASDTVSAVR
ncbi:MAG: hypothetical protein FWD75_04905 [Propionibacteriaceae bacterium]|nr:hypothetical protein [Propionibacteriaceae bacterium]